MSNYSFPKWTETNIPPGPYFRNYRPKWNNLDRPAKTALPKVNVDGLQTRRMPSTYWGNYEFKASNGRYFNSWYDANMYQQLVNAGYNPKDINKLIGEKNPDFHFGIKHLNNSFGNGYVNNHRGYTKGI
jgi:hypothetical protein